MSAIVAALLAELDDQALDQLAAALAPRLMASVAYKAPSPYLDVGEAARYLRCSKQRVYDLVHAGALEPVRDGRRLLFHTTVLDAYLSRPRGATS